MSIEFAMMCLLSKQVLLFDSFEVTIVSGSFVGQKIMQFVSI